MERYLTPYNCVERYETKEGHAIILIKYEANLCHVEP